jgi:hypothetical protein
LTFANGDQETALLSFPVLVVLNSERVNYDQMASDGSDIRFVDGATDAILPYEIDDWNPAGTSYLSVRVPTISAESDESFTESSLHQSAEDQIIGARDDGAVGHFQGLLDEVRISATNRSADWIAAQYLSMTDQFIAYGLPESDVFAD